ncbi:PH domain-containing protein [Enterococcus pingfangensis]|uniref:PH domain-containing protein n=1 Tax=Enterococcus pingfangensis TaxID=2559924 RepID=UPI0010F93D51|nr:PH domain-containing protein [Enterococcus pingfangensis]
MSEKKRFHPLAILIFLLKGIRTWFFLLVLLIINGWIYTLYGKLAAAALVLLIIGSAIANYFSQAYQISSEKIIIYQGIFRKHEIDIPYDRIQTIKQRQWFFFQPFHVVQLLIETAGGEAGKAEASLPAVTEELIQVIEEYRMQEKVMKEPISETAAAKSAVTAEPVYVHQTTNGQILLFGLTDLSILAAAVTLIAFLYDFIPDDWLNQAVSTSERLLQADWVVLVGLGLFLLLVLAAVSIAKNFLQYYNFKVSRYGKNLMIESGLLERRVQKIPLQKIQGIKIRQQILRRLFGISTVELLLAGGQEEEKDISKKLYFLPIVFDQQLFESLDSLLPEWAFDPPKIQYVSRKRLWYFWRWILLAAVPIIGIGYYFNRWLAVGGIVIAVILLLFAWLEAHFQGYALQTDTRLCVQTFAGFSKVQTFVEQRKIQAFSERTTWRLYPKKIGHVSFWLKTGTTPEKISLSFIDWTDITEIKQFFLKEKTFNRY